MGAHVSVPLWQRTIKSRYKLEALQCGQCGQINFPPLEYCHQCKRFTATEKKLLSGKGEVFSFTVIGGGGIPPEFNWLSRVGNGYTVALVKLEEGPLITAQIEGTGGEKPYIGQPVQCCLRKLYEEEGVIRYCYKFRLL